HQHSLWFHKEQPAHRPANSGPRIRGGKTAARGEDARESDRMAFETAWCGLRNSQITETDKSLGHGKIVKKIAKHGRASPRHVVAGCKTCQRKVIHFPRTLRNEKPVFPQVSIATRVMILPPRNSLRGGCGGGVAAQRIFSHRILTSIGMVQ